MALRIVSCTPALPNVAANQDVILGGQGQYVKLTSSNVGYSGGVFAFDVTVQNLIAQPLATTDGTTGTSDGVRVFFASGPTVTGGTGSASVANADGTATFTASNQPYFGYSGSALGADGILTQNETSSSKNWRLNVDPTVSTFSFVVYVSTAVQHPHGYVTMSEDSNYVSSGSTHTITATVRTVVGAQNNSAAPITWSSSNTAIATVDGSGTVTGVAPGTVTISATSDTLVGRTALRICPNMSTVGSSYVVSSDTASFVCLSGASSAAAEYVAIPYNGTTSGTLSYSFTGVGIQAAAGPPNPDVAPANFRQALTRFAASSGSNAFQQRLRAGMTSRTNAARRSSFTRSAGRTVTFTAGARGPSRSITPNVVPAVGDTMIIDVQSACTGTPSNRGGVVRSVSSRAIVVADTGNPVGGFTTAQFDSIGLEFDTVAYVVDSTNFGDPTDNDGNGRTVLFFTRAVNDLGFPQSSDVYYGSFNPKDLKARSPSGCVTSNEGELLYMAVPDPASGIGARSVDSTRAAITPALTHHFEHLVNAWRRTSASQPLEQFFLDEALADEATELAFYRTSAGLSPRNNIQASDITSGPNTTQRTAAFNNYVRPDFARLKTWLVEPDTTGDQYSEASRGVFWAFLRYAADRTNTANESDFWRSLVNSGLVGVANLDNAIGADALTWTRDFTGAVYADDAVSGVSSIYTIPSWNIRSIYGTLFGGFPLLTRSLTDNSAFGINLDHGAASYLRFGVPANTFAKLLTTESAGTPTSTFSMIIIRTK